MISQGLYALCVDIDLSKIYSGKTILVTGHTGFKGAWLVSILKSWGANVIGIGLDPVPNSIWTQTNFEVEDIRLDICDFNKTNKVISKLEFDLVFHLAAQPIVSVAYKNPIETYETNSLAMANLLVAVSKVENCQGVVAVTTDKVYKPSDITSGHKESDPLGGVDPYGASKAAAEIYIDGLRNVISRPNFKIVTVRAGNVIGGGDISVNRLIPDLLRAYESNKQLVIRNPNYVRPWIHVLDVLNGYLQVGARILNRTDFPDSINFGPRPSDLSTVIKVVEMARVTLSGKLSFTIEESDFKEDSFLFLNSDLAKAILGWQPKLTIEGAVDLTLNWWMKKFNGADTGNLIEADLNYFFNMIAN